MRLRLIIHHNMKRIRSFFWRQQTKKAQRGFTIVELLIYMGILSVLLVVLVQIFTALVDLRLESEASSGVEQDGRYLLTRMVYDVHRAQSISTPVNLGESGNTLVLSIGGENYQYSLSGTDLIFTTPTESYQVNGYETDVSNVSFRKLGNDTGRHSIQITYTVASKTQSAGGPETKTVTTTVGLR